MTYTTILRCIKITEVINITTEGHIMDRLIRVFLSSRSDSCRYNYNRFAVTDFRVP
jgi:hypothetical protein